MRLLLAALLAALSLTGCANACRRRGPPAPPQPAPRRPAAPFYLEGTANSGRERDNGLTGQAERAIAAPAGAGSFPWNPGRTTWYPCGAAPDDRAFLAVLMPAARMPGHGSPCQVL